MATTILRLPAVIAKTGLRRSTIYKQVLAGLWPRPIRVGARAVGWVEREADLILAARVAGRSDVELRALVAELEAARRQEV